MYKKSSPHRVLTIILMTLIAFVTAVLWTLTAARWEQLLRNTEKRKKLQTLCDLLINKQR
jgi:uncharacterized membrane protein YidH (DUF202 family)